MNCPFCQTAIAPNMVNCPACGRSPASFQMMGGYAPGYATPPGYGYGGVPQYVYPSRGGTILVLGILSLVLCSIMGPIAWSMGNEEMRRVAAGQAPPDGNANAGRICGMIATILLIVGGAFFLFALAAMPR